jgi:hypothetical protein
MKHRVEELANSVRELLHLTKKQTELKIEHVEAKTEMETKAQ